MELLVDFLVGPAEAHGVLSHLQSAGSHATCVDGLARSEECLSSDELLGSLGGATHVADLCYADGVVGENHVGIGAVELVLCGTRHIDIGLLLPGLASFEELRAFELLFVGLADVVAAGAELEHVFNLLGIEAGGIVDVAVGTADGDDFCTKLGSLLGCTPGNIAEAGDGNGLIFQIVALGGEHVLYEIDGTITGGLGTDARAAELQALAGEHALELVCELLIHAEEVADFATAYADVASGNVLVGTDVAIELGHEGLAETHDLSVTLSAGSEVGAALATAHGECGECVLECLLKAEELQDGEVDRGVEAQTAFVRANGGVELHAIADVDLYFAFVVDPGYTERDDAFGFHKALDELCLLKLRMLVVDVLDGFQYFFHCLQEFRLARVFTLQVLDDFLNFHSN